MQRLSLENHRIDYADVTSECDMKRYGDGSVRQYCIQRLPYTTSVLRYPKNEYDL